MGNERYGVKISNATMTFDFISEGPRGSIKKRVEYKQMGENQVYNLAFGDKDLNTGEIDDLVITDNKDSQKVLATVASTVYAFTNKYPRAFIGATGSTKARTRLYQMGISNNLEKITADFNVLGRKEGTWYIFEKNIEYDAFLIKRKK